MNLIADLDQFVVLVLDHAHGLCRLLEDVILALALLLQTAGARPQHLQLALQVLDPVNRNTRWPSDSCWRRQSIPEFSVTV